MPTTLVAVSNFEGMVAVLPPCGGVHHCPVGVGDTTGLIQATVV